MPEPKTQITDADLELLLAEADRDDPILSLPREERDEPRESLDSQILAGLVSRSDRRGASRLTTPSIARRCVAASARVHARGRGRVADAILAPEHAARHPQRGQPVRARAEQAARRGLHRAVAALLARGAQAAVEPSARPPRRPR